MCLGVSVCGFVGSKCVWVSLGVSVCGFGGRECVCGLVGSECVRLRSEGQAPALVV